VGRNTLTRKKPATGSRDADPLVGQTIDGRYLVEGVLGEGGMGVVYQARHTGIDRKVALKVLRSEFANDREILERFVLEAKTASSLGNPHIVDILDFGRLSDGSTYFAMEHLDGISLTEAINQRLKPERIARLGIQVCDGLAAAHARNIVHRDLKPDNIFILNRQGQDFVKLLDFGIAKVSTDATQKLTRAGAVFGTPHYMSPEQAAGTTVDHRADIYALGVILYEMASGKLPFDSDNFMGILTQHMYKAPIPIRALVNNSDCPPGLEAIVQKCLEKLPGSRYQSVTALAEDLKLLLAGQIPQAVNELLGKSNRITGQVDYFKHNGPALQIVPGTPPETKKSKTGAVLIGLLVCLAAAAAAGGYMVVRQRAEQPSGTALSTAPTGVPPNEPTVTAPPTEAAPSNTVETTPVAVDSATALAVESVASVATPSVAPPPSTGPRPTAVAKPTGPAPTATARKTSEDPWEGPTKIFGNNQR
jgi:serine/threonine-protein kinase